MADKLQTAVTVLTGLLGWLWLHWGSGSSARPPRIQTGGWVKWRYPAGPDAGEAPTPPPAPPVPPTGTESAPPPVNRWKRP